MFPMTVLVLDARWPTLVPMEAYGRIENPVVFTGEVPIAVRWDFDKLITGEDVTGRGTLVTTNPHDDEVLARIARGEQVFTANSLADPVRQAQEAMSRVVSIGQWEAEQDHESLLPYLHEETQEFADAVRAQASDEELRKELGDVLLQVLFHAEIASRRGSFDFGAVAQSFVDKMHSRAPYLFDHSVHWVEIEEQERLWATGKAAERGD